MSRIFLSIFVSLSLSSCFSPQNILSGMLVSQKSFSIRERVLYANDHSSSCLSPIGNAGKIVLIPIQGVINEGGFISDSTTSPAYVERVVQAIKNDTAIKAILLYVNSPGGTVTASDMIYRQIQELKKKTKLPVYAHIATLGASGGYYVAMAADHVNARPTARIGSIGVIMRSFSVEGLLKKYGVHYQPIATGKNKDTGSIFKDMKEEEKEYLKSQLALIYNKFIDIIFTSRNSKLNKKALLELANGKVYDAQFAKKSGLIDSVDYFSDYLLKISRDVLMQEIVVVSWLPRYMPATNVHELDISMPLSTNFTMSMLKKLTQQKMFYIWNPGF